jgi:tripartite motif-containing protein 71
MYVLGGMIGRDDTDTDTVLRFDITEGTWNSVAPMPEPRHAMAACAVGSDIFVFGGSYQYVRTKTVFKYDTVANTWSTLGDRALMPFACSHHSVSVLDGMVYLVGVAIDPEIRDTFRYDPLSTGEQWSLRARTLSGRNEGASFVNAGKLYAMGGEYDSSVERYDVASDTWTAVGDSLEVRKLCGAVTITSFGPEEHDLFDTLLKESRSQRQ